MGCFHWLYLMDMKDASAAIKTQNSGDDITGFADQLASCLVKETIKESGTKIGDQEQEWSIPCSRICHKHSNDTGSGVVACEAGTSGGVRPSSGHLCWTPETGEGVQEVENQCSDTMGQEDTIRKGVSVPNINVSQASANSDPEHDTTDRLSCSSENSKSHKSRGFLNILGIKTKHKSDISNSTRPKMKGFKKTLSSLFSAKTRDSTENSSERNKKPTSSKFKLPSVSKRSKAVDPCQRALPPVPPSRDPPRDVPDLDDHEDDDNRLGVAEFDHEQLTPHHSPSQISPRSGADNESDIMDFAASIERVKDRGWYWGPLSGEAAERLLASEPDASFVVRDSSDHHYIFSLTFKLNGVVRHVRIEHDQGNFSFGSLTRFKNSTIVDFIENAVEHSKSGRYLFFLHRRPVLGPMRVQLLYPVSRFKSVQSLQHLCRYVIVKVVRKDHLDQLPVPNRIKKYLNTSFYYSEQVSGNEEASETTQTLQQIQENVDNWDQDEENSVEVDNTPESENIEET